MLIFNNLEEMKPFYNEETETYKFIEDGNLLDVEFNFSLFVDANIKAGDIKAWNIKAGNINAWNIKAVDINARDINARNINARDVNAGDIKAVDINAWNIRFYAICCAYSTFRCKTINGARENAKYFCLDNEVEFIKT